MSVLNSLMATLLKNRLLTVRLTQNDSTNTQQMQTGACGADTCTLAYIATSKDACHVKVHWLTRTPREANGAAQLWLQGLQH